MLSVPSNMRRTWDYVWPVPDDPETLWSTQFKEKSRSKWANTLVLNMNTGLLYNCPCNQILCMPVESFSNSLIQTASHWYENDVM